MTKKVVTIVSNHLTNEPQRKCQRYSKLQKGRIQVNQPHVIGEYNSYMGGVDKLDGYLTH